jgi:carboxymethylenebutenolidase
MKQLTQRCLGRMGMINLVGSRIMALKLQVPVTFPKRHRFTTGSLFQYKVCVDTSNRSDPMSPLDQLTPMQRYLVHEFVEDYEDGLMSRRDMISRVLHITGGIGAAATVLTSLGVQSGGAQGATPAPPSEPQSPLTVAENDPRLFATDVTFSGADEAQIRAYQVSLIDLLGEPLPLVMICHENRGLTDHIRDVARRFAVEGYLALAIDLLSREGGTDQIEDPSEIPALLTEGDMNRHVADFQAAISHYQTSGEADLERIAMTGFCFGGGITWRAATQIPELKAAVAWYGPPPPLEDVPNIQAPVLGIYSDDPDDFANEGRDELVAALEEAGVTHQINVYPDTQHAFHNDTGQRYNEEQALAAWQDTLDWFSQHLTGDSATPMATPEG